MKKYILFVLGFLTILAVPFQQSGISHGVMKPDEIKAWRQCDPTTPERQAAFAAINGSATNFENYLKEFQQPYKITASFPKKGGGTVQKELTANFEYFKEFCLLVYGDHNIVYDSIHSGDQTICQNKAYKKPSYSQYRYLGFVQQGTQWIGVLNPHYCPLGGQDPEYVKTAQFIKNPWTGTHYEGIKNQASWGNIPIPAKPNTPLDNPERLAYLRTVIDGWVLYDNPNAATIGNFNQFSTGLNGTLVQGSLTDNKDVTYDKTPLTDYSDVNIKPTTYTAGNLLLYKRYGTSAYRYSGYIIPPYQDPTTKKVFKQDLELTKYSFSPSASSMKAGTKFTNIKYTVKNNGTVKFSGITNFEIQFSTGECYTAKVDFSKTPIEPGKEVEMGFSTASPKCDLSSKAVPITYPSVDSDKKITARLIVNARYKSPVENLIDTDIEPGKTNPNYANNWKLVDLDVIADQNASVEIEKAKSSFNVGKSIGLLATVTNNMNKTISSKCTTGCVAGNTYAYYSIKDAQGKFVVQKKEVKFADIEKGKERRIKLEDKLKYGKYTVEVGIAHYNGESTYADNKDTFEITIEPVFPENTTCKSFVGPGSVKKLGNSDITKICLGYAPNYPSTNVEGGQGTYFFVKYNFLPLPLPTYEIETKDEKGLQQTLKIIKESNTEPGGENNFLHFPTKYGQVPSLNGPYRAGPHDFYHYMYRGRMFARDVNFDFNVKGPKKEIVAEGTVSYVLPDNCYDDNLLDYKDECRSIFFFLPSTVEELDGTYAEEPEDEDKLHFKNPGLHYFQLDVKENQQYRYQFDTGAEWQGSTDTPRDPYPTTGPIKTHTTKTVGGEVVWVIQDTFKNYCYQESDGFGDVVNSGTFVGTNCSHNHNKEYHYWRYSYAKPKWLDGGPYKAQ